MLIVGVIIVVAFAIGLSGGSGGSTSQAPPAPVQRQQEQPAVTPGSPQDQIIADRVAREARGYAAASSFGYTERDIELRRAILQEFTDSGELVRFGMENGRAVARFDREYLLDRANRQELLRIAQMAWAETIADPERFETPLEIRIRDASRPVFVYLPGVGFAESD
jgi:hypothetical protein